MAITTVGKNYQGGRKMTRKMKEGDEVFKNVSEMDYSERREYIDKKYLPKLTDASFYFMIHETGFDYDMNGDRQETKKRLLDYYRDNADYTESSLDEDTMYKVKDWEMFRKEIDPDTDEVIDEYELTEVSADNTYNFSYLGAMDLNWRVYHDEEYDKWFYVIHPHLGGDPRGNYGDAFILEGDDKEDLFYRFYQGFISGSASISLTFNDDSSLTFYSEQDSDVYYFRHEIDEDSLDINSVAREYLNDFNQFDGWHGDEFLEETVNAFQSEKKTDKKALGGGAYDDEPRAYVQILGYPEGAWIELKDFSNGSEVMEYISNWMDKLNSEKGGNREEYAIHDYEGYGKHLYNEYMGESEFDEILESYVDYENSDYPYQVIEEYMSNVGSSDLSTAISEMNDKYYGTYRDLEDWASNMIDEGIYTPNANEMYVSDTDKRIISGEEADNRLADMDVSDVLDLVGKTDEFDDKKGELNNELDDLNEKLSTIEAYAKDLEGEQYESAINEIADIEEAIQNKEEEIENLDTQFFDMYRDDAYDIIYDETYNKLDRDLEEWLDEYGYSTSDLSNIPFVQIDYKEVADNLSADFLVIEHDGRFYIFNYYKGGGKVVRMGKAKKYPFYVVNLDTKKIVGGFDHKEDAQDNKIELSKNNPKLKFGVYKHESLRTKFNIEDCTSYSNWIDLRDLDKSSKVNLKKKSNHPLKGKRYDEGGQMQQQEVTDADFQMQQEPSKGKQVASHFGNMAYEQGQQDLQAIKEYMEKDTWKGRIKRGAKKVGEGASWLRQKWINADFGDGKGKAKFFREGGVSEDWFEIWKNNGFLDEIVNNISNKIKYKESKEHSKVASDIIENENFYGDREDIVKSRNYIISKLNQKGYNISWLYADGGRTGYKVLAELHTLKDKGVKYISLNGFTEDIEYVINLKLDDRDIKKLGERSYETTYKRGGMTKIRNGWVLYDEDTERLIKVYETESEARKNLYEYDGNANIVEKSVWDKKNYADGGTAQLGEVSGMLPNPLPMSTITPMAKGGLTEHGLKVGDKIVFERLQDDSIEVKDSEGEKHIVDLETGTRFDNGGGVSDERTVLEAKAIEFITGSAIDLSSIKHEGDNITFKYKHHNYHSSLSKKLVDNTIQFNRRSLEGRRSFKTGGITTKGENDFRKMNMHDAVLYKNRVWYITKKDNVVGIINYDRGAWGSDYPFIPLSKINMSDLTDMGGNKVSIEKYEIGGFLYDDYNDYSEENNDDKDIVQIIKMNDLCVSTLVDFVNSMADVHDVLLDDTNHLIFVFRELPTIDIIEDINLFLDAEEVTDKRAGNCNNIFTGDVNYLASSPKSLRVGIKDGAKFTSGSFAKGGSVPSRDKMFELPLEMVVYVPSTQDVDNVISVDEMDARVNEVKTYLANKFGGYTSSEKIGGFVDSKGNLVNEEITQVVSFSTKDAFEQNKKELVDKLAQWGKEWGQEAIGFEFEGDLLYVPQADQMKRGGELWIQDAVSKMKAKGTEGAFTKQAKREGMTPIEFAKKVLKNPSKYSTRTFRRANFVRNTNPDKF